MKPQVYILRGAPASGKSTLVRKFCELLPKPVALIEQDMFRWDLHLIGRKIPDLSDEEHWFSHRNTLLIYEQYLKNGRYTIVIEGVFTWDDPSTVQGNAVELIKLAQKYNFGHHSIVLKANKKKLLERNAKRPYSVPQAEFDTLYKNVYNKVDPSEAVIDSTGHTESKSLRELKALIP